MAIRPIDIARKLKISTTTLRYYEDMGLIPEVERTASDYRQYTDEHAAYFVCVREMLVAFGLTFVRPVLQAVQRKDFDHAFLLLNSAQASLWNDRQIARKLSERIGRTQPSEKLYARLTIGEISQETGIPVTTIRYWEKAGLVVPLRNQSNKYRFYGDAHIEQLLVLHTIKLSVKTLRGKHFISNMREAYQTFDPTDHQQTRSLVNKITIRLDETNRLQMHAISALYTLYRQAESGKFRKFC